MKNVLVTGGAGFIGSNFVRYILKNEPGVSIVNLDALTYSGSLENLRNLPGPNRHIFVEGDMCDGDLVSDILRTHQIDTIVHFAAETHVDRSILGPEQFIRTNVLGTATLLECTRSFWMTDKALPRVTKRFHHISTDEVFGMLSDSDPAWTENSSYAPNSPYAASKAAADHVVRSYGHTYGFPYSITNCSNNYGPYQFPEKLIPLVLLNALEGRPLPVYGDGGQVRDWLHVEDHCAAIRLVLQKGHPGETYLVAGNNQPTNLTVIHTLCEILDRLVPDSPHIPHINLITHVEDRPGHDRRYAMNTKALSDNLGWKPSYSLETGFEQTVKWYLTETEWIEAIRSKPEYRRWIDDNYTQRKRQ
ncbi:dTDP-glucose 4,6-dehydratase [Candidatus Latescibacterota bacterium]